MYKIFEYSHLGGSEILQVRYAQSDAEINSVIESIVDVRRLKESAEKTRKGRMLYSPRDLNQRFRDAFKSLGYNELKDRFDIEIPGHAYKIKGNYKQVDFAKDGVLCEVQFGKYCAMFYDLAKFQYFFNELSCEVGVEIVPAHRLKKQMSSGVAYGEQLIFDTGRLRRHFPAVPVKVILIDVEPKPETMIVVEESERESLATQTEDLPAIRKRKRR
jgi:hypothetical protein